MSALLDADGWPRARLQTPSPPRPPSSKPPSTRRLLEQADVLKAQVREAAEDRANKLRLQLKKLQASSDTEDETEMSTKEQVADEGNRSRATGAAPVKLEPQDHAEMQDETEITETAEEYEQPEEQQWDTKEDGDAEADWDAEQEWPSSSS